jgi:hypothetical protein
MLWYHYSLSSHVWKLQISTQQNTWAIDMSALYFSAVNQKVSCHILLTCWLSALVSVSSYLGFNTYAFSYVTLHKGTINKYDKYLLDGLCKVATKLQTRPCYYTCNVHCCLRISFRFWYICISVLSSGYWSGILKWFRGPVDYMCLYRECLFYCVP